MPSASVSVATALSADSQIDSSPTPKPDRRGIAVLIACITVALERFGFYTLVSLFVPYLVDRRGHVAPIGFSLVSKLAPKRLLGVLMGAWFAAIALGNFGAGLIGRYWLAWPHRWFFFALATTSGFAALLLMLQRGRLRRVLGGSKHV